MTALISMANGTVAAQYEYGPFGELLRATGPMAKANPFRFSTKYQDDETDIVMYPGRPYRDGRFLSRDPAEEVGGFNLYCFVGNDPISRYDALGFWGTSVHKDRTTQWAQQLGIQQATAEAIGVADDAIDSLHDPKVINNDNWSWHFNRSRSGDSRFDHREDELKAARAQCKSGVDNPTEAAKHLGYALHPDQDWVAHADYNRIQETPNATVWSTDVAYYIHNYGASGSGSTGWPDDEGLDADGSTAGGRATIEVLKGVHGGHKTLGNKDVVYWVTYHPGVQRLVLTRDRTKAWLGQFQEYVRGQDQACKCKAAFLGK